MSRVFTDDGRIVLVEHDVLRGCIVDYDKGLAFLMSEQNQYFSQAANSWVQVLGERSTIPLCIITPLKTDADGKNLTDRIDQIFRDTSEAEKLRLWLNSSKDNLVDKILWLIGIPAVTLLLMYGMKMMNHNKEVSSIINSLFGGAC